MSNPSWVDRLNNMPRETCAIESGTFNFSWNASENRGVVKVELVRTNLDGTHPERQTKLEGHGRAIGQARILLSLHGKNTVVFGQDSEPKVTLDTIESAAAFVDEWNSWLSNLP